ncbi:MAG: patatin-like phospholipase family protein [Proteobacteria bacterium]|nr:patatin-like phospholipase family protein [Pseudomonadota bacterium]
MGITIVQRSDLERPRPRGCRALILAGGAITGGSFMAGGLRALNRYIEGAGVGDFDVFVGISSGSMLAAALAAGISPESMIKSLDGTSSHFSQLTAWHCYRPNVAEIVSRPLKFFLRAAMWLPGGVVRVAQRHDEWRHGILGSVWRFVLDPSRGNYDDMMVPLLEMLDAGDFPSLLALLPSGLFDNGPIESYFRENIERNRLTNDFCEAARITGKRLYISAVRLDGARRVVFGADEEDSLTISEAIQASTALPGFYKPAHIGGEDYVDGGVQETANIDTAVEKGAKLIVCYNPFRPYDPELFVKGMSRRRRSGKRLATDGIATVLNQILRAFFHARLAVAVRRFREDPSFDGDIILIEPRGGDEAYFSLNPMLLRNRIAAAKLGFESVRASIGENFDGISRIMAAHGIRMNRSKVDEEYTRITRPGVSEREIQRLLEGREIKAKREKHGGSTPVTSHESRVTKKAKLKKRKTR